MRKTDYRHSLKRDLDRWKHEGLIAPDLADVLLEQSGEGLSDASRGTQLLPAMIGLATALGVLSIIAANWAALAPGLRIVLVTVLAAAPLGAALWKNQTPRPLYSDIAIGLSAVLLGGLLVTIGQAYHTGATTEDFLRTWMIGVVVLAALARSPAALFVSSLLLFGYFWSSALFGVAGQGGPPAPRLDFWLFAGGVGFLAWRVRALASWHPLMIAVIAAITFLIIHYSWPFLPEAGRDEAKAVWAIVTGVCAFLFLAGEVVRRLRSYWGVATFAGWACFGFCFSLFALVIAFRADLQAGALDFAYWGVSVIALLVASALIGYGGLRRLGFYRAFGVLLFVSISAFVFLSVGGLMEAGLVLIVAGLMLLGLLHFSGRILARLFGEGEAA
jgi:uncharacterized membrane protein